VVPVYCDVSNVQCTGTGTFQSVIVQPSGKQLAVDESSVLTAAPQSLHSVNTANDHELIRCTQTVWCEAENIIPQWFGPVICPSTIRTSQGPAIGITLLSRYCTTYAIKPRSPAGTLPWRPVGVSKRRHQRRPKRQRQHRYRCQPWLQTTGQNLSSQ
jgi:hypothetical protein